MSTTTIAPSKTFNRSRKAARIAVALEQAGVSDARTASQAQWAETGPASEATRSVTTAILDVLHGRLREQGHGGKAGVVGYNTARIATRLAEVLVEVGVEDATTLSPEQWDMARRVAESDGPKIERVSSATKEATVAILSVLTETA